MSDSSLVVGVILCARAWSNDSCRPKAVALQWIFAELRIGTLLAALSTIAKVKSASRLRSFNPQGGSMLNQRLHASGGLMCPLLKHAEFLQLHVDLSEQRLTSDRTFLG